MSFSAIYLAGFPRLIAHLGAFPKLFQLIFFPPPSSTPLPHLIVARDFPKFSRPSGASLDGGILQSFLPL